MKRLKTILLFLVICISCFGQKNASKFDDLIISESFSFDPSGFSFKNLISIEEDIRFNIAIDKKKGSYYCVINIFSKKHYSIDNQTLPHLLLKTDNRELVDLKADTVHTVQFEQQSGKYVTKLIFFIPNIREFVFKNYIKCRVWLREGLYSDFEKDNHSSLFDDNFYGLNSLKWHEFKVTLKYKEYKENEEYKEKLKKELEEEKKKEEEFRKKIKKINDPLYYDF